MITMYVLGNILLLHGFLGVDLLAPRMPWGLRFGWGFALSGALLLTVVRVQVELRTMQKKERARATYLSQLKAEAGGNTLIESGLADMMDYLRLFKPYGFSSYHRVVSLTGWNTYDPSQPALRTYLTRQSDMAVALSVLGQQQRATWLLKPQSATYMTNYLNFRLQRSVGHRIWFEPIISSLPPECGLRRYEFREESVRSSAQPVPVHPSAHL